MFYEWGAAMGAEQRGKGSSVMLGPATALTRVPWSGRVFEYPGEEVVLSAALVGPMVRGIQSNNISASVKHFAFNSQELNRGDARGSPGMSSNVDERVGRELYGPPYAAAVDAGVNEGAAAPRRKEKKWKKYSPVTPSQVEPLERAQTSALMTALIYTVYMIYSHRAGERKKKALNDAPRELSLNDAPREALFG